MRRKGGLRIPDAIKRTAVLLVAAIAVVLLVALTAHANGAQIQAKNETTYDTNLIKFKRVEYVGQCPGTAYTPDTINARFNSSSNLPAPKRRVVIKNVTEGMKKNPYPYTDREYDKGESSESFEVKFGDSHKGRTFSVLEGENKFEYAIKERDTVVEQGTFTAEVSVKDLGVFSRAPICGDRESCHDETYYDDDRSSRRRNRRPRTRRICQPIYVCSCPG
ncbi:hypothetical protein H6F77_10805 [Microcoleus sp. FACHB-831]|uniref:hypothetical protein n=1 Tax=Microcoleus sp. FACHB-831 TaxID=2692827 RepID=UPI0016884126|nr:hypothetical protein [Microcoleus sp. FACHB-831]MBD1921580.1 hypothetical protein [Microcoleus sp. FACHB-831]